MDSRSAAGALGGAEAGGAGDSFSAKAGAAGEAGPIAGAIPGSAAATSEQPPGGATVRGSTAAGEGDEKTGGSRSLPPQPEEIQSPRQIPATRNRTTPPAHNLDPRHIKPPPSIEYLSSIAKSVVTCHQTLRALTVIDFASILQQVLTRIGLLNGGKCPQQAGRQPRARQIISI